MITNTKPNWASRAMPSAEQILEDVRALFAEITPAPLFASSDKFSDHAAIKITNDRRDYCLAGPGFWKKLPRRTLDAPMNPFGGIIIVDLDDPSQSSLRKEVFELVRKFGGGQWLAR